ncbi:MAG TPA: DUF4397 domain-containing protein [Myxococcaceae bacterium]|nr:DUF4397 domain-containing protein [Myxococcaceae bacterium]
MSRPVPVPFFLAVVLALACDSSSPGPGQLRVAHLIPDGPAIDVCLKPDTAAAFGTPLVGGGGLSYPSLSTRSGFDAGTYSVRLVQGGSTSCSSTLNGLGDVSASISADAPQTLVLTGRLTGSGSPSLTVKVIGDRTAAAPSGSVLFRGMNAAPGSNPQDMGVVASQLFSPFATNVAYGAASDYLQIGGIAPGSTNVTAPLASRDTSSQTLWASGTFNNVSDTGVYTLFVIGVPGQTGTPRPSLLLCSDGSVNCAQSP